MPHDQKSAAPRLYLLNERHQLAPTPKEGGRQPQPVREVNWKSHGGNLRQSIESFRSARKASPDPTSQKRLFVVATPPKSLTRSSESEKAKDGGLPFKVDLAGKQSQVISRLGFDLLGVTKDGSAIVHASDERIEQMAQSLGRLDELRTRDKNRWAHITNLTEIPTDYKTSLEWWGSPTRNALLESAIDLQPCLTRPETDLVIKAISSLLKDGEKLKRTGKEFTGRTWLAAVLRPKTILHLAEKFQSIYSIHPPLVAIAAGPPKRSSASPSRHRQPLAASDVDRRALPCVAVIDTGIPSEHVWLSPYRRLGHQIGDGTSGEVQDDHGSLVASRIVFGEVECDQGMPPEDLIGACSVFDVRVGNGMNPDGSSYVDPSVIHDVIGKVTGSARDIRVFNLSVDSQAHLDFYEGSLKDAWLRRIEDLDNRAFSEDILLVVAAGNSPRGLVPEPGYPNHAKQPEWSLGAWSRCFNALTCGGSADRPATGDEVTKELGSPSPFTRVGPGFAKSLKPDLAAHAGNCGPDYQYAKSTGVGVWCCNDSGLWEDHAGTSFAAPLIAREAARTFAFLQAKCESSARPFAALVKATLALHARPPTDLSPRVQKLAESTLGYGAVRYEDIESPNHERAVFLWQGIIGNESEILTVELPLPGAWVESATKPVLRLIAAWDTPVNHAAEHVWACRKVDLKLRPAGGHPTLPSKSLNRSGYPLIEKRYDLSGEIRSELQHRDNCLAELSYTTLEMAPYPGPLDFTPQQRIAIVYELFDEGKSPVSPHAAIQSLPIAVEGSLNKLSSIVPSSRQAVTIRMPV